MRELKRPITNLENPFREFKDCEDKLPVYLVRPSGSLKSPLAHRLNQPSVTTRHTQDSKMADISNGCIAMVIGNAYVPGKTLLFDHIHRRDARSEGIEQYDPQLLNCHKEYTDKPEDPVA
ncbi:hypothetical protein QBC33DRAFT_530262 [Phialemonium atrogriseum]|uniref:Uncharacterized protein n=1 Tax=Phialemonium atrogriseum TaxID=1093897 RepID=A0AAJ0C4T4_9PEZI|nr:uncharacterized protein QBC33DRAFT_530262 [Phialemonium atrogriseum]KAK1770153.1 hypothetical protein QBC33DRAFT_530262 [Phialemonium atrogriseum]